MPPRRPRCCKIPRPKSRPWKRASARRRILSAPSWAPAARSAADSQRAVGQLGPTSPAWLMQCEHHSGARAGEEVGSDEVVGLPGVAAIDEADGGGFGDVVDIDAGEIDIAEGLGIDPLLSDAASRVQSTGRKLSGIGASPRVERSSAQCMASTPPIRAKSVRKAGSWSLATIFVSATAALRSSDAA